MALNIHDFREQTLELGKDYEGRVTATVVHSPKNIPNRPSVLYIHGFNDYFFQAHVAAHLHEHGYNFYGLDLRKYGRSLLPHQHPNYCRSLTEYFEEIDHTIEIIKGESDQEIIFLGHSTGGLIQSFYLNKGRYKTNISKAILNSPFLQFNLPKWQRKILLPASGIISFFAPYSSQKKPLSHLYSASILQKEYGEWHFNTNWKPPRGFPAYFKWVYAIYKAQTYLHKHSNIQIPMLILHSDQSSYYKKWNDIILKTDMVLNVHHIKSYGTKLGTQVDFSEIPGAIHDVFLSQKEIRSRAFESVFKWLNEASEAVAG
ncbi:alpha/beta hydrolase [Gracilimonas tropica]|uniref:alpha/beta hydrolase n=1 Tax=Gracilimonas tropica TaxID=454600 RepID=UPI000382A990|nr:alpha/beta hydrolase [Gracilimonas tropica]